LPLTSKTNSKKYSLKYISTDETGMAKARVVHIILLINLKSLVRLIYGNMVWDITPPIVAMA
jgi:hypothetical protein